MNKGQFLKAFQGLDDSIEIEVLDCQNMPLSIKHIDYVFDGEQEAVLQIVPMGAHQEKPKAVQVARFEPTHREPNRPRKEEK